MSLQRAGARAGDRHTFLSPPQVVTLWVLAVALLPPVAAYVAAGLPAVFRFFAADAFVYLSVAAKSQPGVYTVVGGHPTNGFLPLWLVLVQGVFQAFGIGGAKELQLAAAFWLSVALVTAGGVCIAQAVLRWSGSMLAAMLAVPGLFGMGMMLAGWPTGTLWSFMNGMESPASLFFFGLLLHHLSRRDAPPLVTATGVDRNSLLLLSLISAGIVFSRLDDVFLPAIFAIWLLLAKAPFANRIRAALWFGLPLGAALLAYLAFNAVVVGHAMPISAAAKLDFRTPLLNLGFLGSSLHALVPDFLYDPFTGNEGDLAVADVNWRNVQLLGPVIAARVLLANMRWLEIDRAPRFAVWMRLLLVYVMAKGVYNFLFVPLIHQGHWYFPLSIAIVNVATAMILARLAGQWAAHRPVAAKLALPAVGVATAAFLAVFTLGRTDTTDDSNRFFELFRSGPRIAATLETLVPQPRIVEADDGIIGYALGLPTMSGFLFATDPAAYRAYAEGRLLAEASRRGYQLIGSLYYLRNVPASELTPEAIPDMLRTRLFNATRWDLDKFDFDLAHRDAATGAVFIRFTPKR
jgi:hypothetical protein